MYTLGNQFSLLAEAVGKGWKGQGENTGWVEWLGSITFVRVSPGELRGLVVC